MADSRTSYAPLTILVLFAYDLKWVFRFSYEIPPHKNHAELHNERIKSQAMRERKMDLES